MEDKLNIAMVCDFMFPNVGGIEAHIFQLSRFLTKRGHNVVIITHAYGNRQHVRYLNTNVKVYYLNLQIVVDNVMFPTVYGMFPLLRYILVRESVDLLHAHQAFSSMAHEAILHAGTMNIKCVFTDHSLFSFENTSSILTNKLLKFTLSQPAHIICVSHTSKENTVLRASLNPYSVSVIPNAIVSAEFLPDVGACDPKFITIVVTSRLVYRKGTDLLVDIIPIICSKYSNARFLIVGDGPKRVNLEQMRETHELQDRVTLFGSIQNSKIRNILVQGDIFLNTSLTEAFCIAIVEAASCGLLVVSTRVGGIPEVLPADMIILGDPTPESMTASLDRAIGILKGGKAIDKLSFHERVKRMYTWDDVAIRTERAYESIMQTPHISISDRFARYYTTGSWAGKLSVMILAIDYIILFFLEIAWPARSIEKARKLKNIKSKDC